MSRASDLLNQAAVTEANGAKIQPAIDAQEKAAGIVSDMIEATKDEALGKQLKAIIVKQNDVMSMLKKLADGE